MIPLYKRSVKAIITQQGQESLELSGRISFDVSKTGSAFSNKAKIEFYNLTRQTRAIFENPNVLCQLIAGYEGQESLLFVGNVRYVDPSGKDTVVSTRNSGDIITTIECTDAQQAYDAYVSFEVSEGEPIEKYVRKALSVMGVAIGSTKIPDAKFPASKAFDQPAKTFLNELLNPLGIQWAITDGIFYSVEEDKPDEREIVKLAPTSGLFSGLQKKSAFLGGERKIVQLEGSCLLNPVLKPFSIVEIETAQFSEDFQIENLGLWQIMEATHRGDNYGSDFTTSFKARAYGIIVGT